MKRERERTGITTSKVGIEERWRENKMYSPANKATMQCTSLGVASLSKSLGKSLLLISNNEYDYSCKGWTSNQAG